MNLFRPKLFSLLKNGISKKQLTADVMSGIVVGIVALPLAIAFAVASGVSPEKGIITAVIAGFIISFLGGSRVQIGGPTGAFIVIVYAIVEQYGVNGLIISTVLAGIMLIGFGLLKLGNLLKFFPHPLIVGFTSGIALVIFSTQIKDAFGLPIEKVPAPFLEKWVTYAQNLNQINWMALIITVVTIILTLYSKKITRRIPGSFIAIILVTVTVQMFAIPVNTIESFFGDIPRNFTFSLPQIDIATLSVYLAPALTIAMLGGIESLLSAVVADGMIGGNHRSNTELIAQGIANIVTPFFGGIPATGAIARTATNVKNGGRTPIAGIIHALTLLLIMLFFGKYAKLIPMACLAGILIVVAYNMSEWRSFKAILQGSSFDIIVLLSTFLLTVLVDLTIAIEIGVLLSALLFMKRMSDVGTKGLITVESDQLQEYNNIPSEIGIYEISGPFFFGSAKEYGEIIKQTGYKSKILILRMRYVPFIDATGLHNLEASLKMLKSSGITVLLSGVNPEVRNVLEKNNILPIIGTHAIYSTFDEAVAKGKDLLEELTQKPKSK